MHEITDAPAVFAGISEVADLVAVPRRQFERIVRLLAGSPMAAQARALLIEQSFVQCLCCASPVDGRSDVCAFHSGESARLRVQDAAERDAELRSAS